ncbi:MAG: hypothetical protein ACR2RL_04525, partial [Gammaproteobacteria bacterium]
MRAPHRRPAVLGSALILGLQLSTSAVANTGYPLHTNITATAFWVGEPVGNGSSEDNALSAYDD